LPPTVPDSATVKPPSPWEPVTAMRRMPIVEAGDPLIDFAKEYPDLLLDRQRFRYTRATYARRTVAEMLARADDALRSHHRRLAIVEVWRPPHIQRRMYLSAWNRWREQHPEWSDAQLRRVTNRFTAPVNDRRVPPPHSTGGAVDLALVDLATGEPLDVHSPYELFDTKAFPFAAPNLTDAARRNRDLLAEAVLSTGLTNYPSEYWHWSYGDQGWAYRGGHPHALYGPIVPEGYTPDPADTIDDPLEWIEQ